MLTSRFASTSKEKPYVVPAVVEKPSVGKHDWVPAATSSFREYRVLGAGGGAGAVVSAGGGLEVVAGGGGADVEVGAKVVVDETAEQASPLRS
jgi:hypothetical protein